MKSIETEPYMRRVKTSTALSCHHRQLLSITPLENSDSSVYEYFWNSSRNQTYYFLKVAAGSPNPRTACHDHTFNCYSYQSNQFNVQRLNLEFALRFLVRLWPRIFAQMWLSCRQLQISLCKSALAFDLRRFPGLSQRSKIV
ncbi:Hypothetical_protein [Hexamita inflata]|uniref:Hypothetical_protein n=1 Tax=Hexamita inflata TaxID=28002 RepID=A0ABP1K2M7_9EUKA